MRTWVRQARAGPLHGSGVCASLRPPRDVSPFGAGRRSSFRPAWVAAPAYERRITRIDQYAGELQFFFSLAPGPAVHEPRSFAPLTLGRLRCGGRGRRQSCCLRRRGLVERHQRSNNRTARISAEPRLWRRVCERLCGTFDGAVVAAYRDRPVGGADSCRRTSPQSLARSAHSGRSPPPAPSAARRRQARLRDRHVVAAVVGEATHRSVSAT